MAPILVEVCDGGYGENVMKEGGVMEMFALTGDHLVVSEMGMLQQRLKGLDSARQDRLTICWVLGSL